MKTLLLIIAFIGFAFSAVPSDTVQFLDEQKLVKEYYTTAFDTINELGEPITIERVSDSAIVLKTIRPYERLAIPGGLDVGDTLFLFVRKSGKYGFKRLHIYAPTVPPKGSEYIQPLGKLEVQDIR